MHRAMKTSDAPDDVSIGLSLHGVGMKAAGFWLGRVINVETFPLDEKSGWTTRVDLDDLDVEPEDEDRGHTLVRPIPKLRTSGTVIRVENLWPERFPKGKTPSAIRRYLPSIYRRFLEQHPGDDAVGRDQDVNLHLIYMGSELTFSMPPFLVEPFWPNTSGPQPKAAPVLWHRDLVIGLSNGKEIQGWVGILEQLNRELAGLFFHYRGKGIAGVVPTLSDDDAPSESNMPRSSYKPRIIFGQEGSYYSQSFIGEFDLSAFGKTITTDKPEWTSDEESEFLEKLLAVLQDPRMNFWEQARNVRRRLRSQRESRDDDQLLGDDIRDAVDALGDADLRHLGPNDNPPGGIPPSELHGGMVQFEKSYVLPDAEGHSHLFTVKVIDGAMGALLSVQSNLGAAEHLITIHEDHPSLFKFQPMQGEKRQLLCRIALAIGVSEVFIDGPHSDRFRNKFNEIVDYMGRTR